jgi:hypothetical protein
LTRGHRNTEGRLLIRIDMSWFVRAGCAWRKTLLGTVIPGLLVLQQAAAQDTAVADQPTSNSGEIAPAPAGDAVLPGQPGSTQDKRMFGVLPNYRTADGNAPFEPITTRQKFTIATKDTVDGPSYGLAIVFAGISQLNGSNPSFGQGIKGFARRYASAVSDQDLGNFMTEAIMPALLHEDPRYFRKGHGSLKSRIGYAVTRITVTRTDAGDWRFNSSEFLGNGIVASIGNAYYPDARGLGPTFQRMGTQIGTDAISSVLKEFWPDIKRRFIHKQTGYGITD